MSAAEIIFCFHSEPDVLNLTLTSSVWNVQAAGEESPEHDGQPDGL